MDKKWDKILKEYDVHCIRVKKITSLALGETPKQKASRIKDLEKNYIPWFEHYLSHYAKKKSAPYHEKLANLIIKNPKSKTLVEIYRSGAKSVHVDLGIPLYLYFTGQLKFDVTIGQNANKAKKLLGGVQAELEYNQRLISDYGNRMGQGNWADGDFLTSDGSRFMALGWEQDARGLREGADRPDYIVVDDADNKRHVNNNDMMIEAIDKIKEDILGCFDASDDGNERFVYANNNFHKNGITNRLKAEFNKYREIDKRHGRKSEFTVLTVNAVTDLKTFTPTWPAKTTAEYWRRKYEKAADSFLREYMNTHVNKGKKFKAAWFQYKEMLKLHKYDALIVHGDLSYKDKADYKGMYLLGKTKREYHIIHSFLRQASRREAAAWLYDLYEDRKLYKYNIVYSIDGLFAQDEFVNDFDSEGEDRGYYIPVVPNKEKYGDKFNHIDSTTGRFQRLWVFFNIDEKDHEDVITTVDQYMGFEKGSSMNDDGPDAIAVCMKELDKLAYTEKTETRMVERELENTDY